MTTRTARISRLGPTLFLVIALIMTFSVRGVSAQEASPGATPESMGSCTTALGIGAEGDACINVVHVSPDAPAVDVYLNGEVALEGLEYGSFSDWVAVPAGEHQVQVTAAGEAPDTAVIDAMVTLDEGTAYQIAATGLLADITPQIYPVNLTSVDEDSARLRVIHASPDAPAVDVAVADGDVLVSNLEFPNASEFLTVPADTYDLEVRPTGTTDVALELPGVELEAGMAYDVFAIGQLEDDSLSVLVIPSSTEDPDS